MQILITTINTSTLIFAAPYCDQFTRRRIKSKEYRTGSLAMQLTLRKPTDKIRTDDELFNDKRRMPHYQRLDS